MAKLSTIYRFVRNVCLSTPNTVVRGAICLSGAIQCGEGHLPEWCHTMWWGPSVWVVPYNVVRAICLNGAIQCGGSQSAWMVPYNVVRAICLSGAIQCGEGYLPEWCHTMWWGPYAWVVPYNVVRAICLSGTIQCGEGHLSEWCHTIRS